MKKHSLKSVILTLVFGVFILVCARGANAQQNIKAEYEKLKKEYDKVVADRDNILAQTKYLLEYKVKGQALEIETRKSQEAKTQAEFNFKQLEEKYSRLEKATQDQNSETQAKITALENQIVFLTQERDGLKNYLEKLQIEYKILPETKRQINQLGEEKEELTKKLTQSDAKVKRLEQERLDLDAQVEINRMQVKDFKKRYEEAMSKNKEFGKKLEQMPLRYTELARENKVLIKETALMHYNLGVFYTKSKEYERAVAEFEKAIELNPEDPYGHYNLGYIYAEYILDRPKAIDHFKKFLSLVVTEDKDVDWVKKYILTWQTWEGKKPME